MDKSADPVCIPFWINTNFNHSGLSLMSLNCSQNLQCARGSGSEVDNADNAMCYSGAEQNIFKLPSQDSSCLNFILSGSLTPFAETLNYGSVSDKGKYFPIKSDSSAKANLAEICCPKEESGFDLGVSWLGDPNKLRAARFDVRERGLSLRDVGFWGMCFTNLALWIVCP